MSHMFSPLESDSSPPKGSRAADQIRHSVVISPCCDEVKRSLSSSKRDMPTLNASLKMLSVIMILII